MITPWSRRHTALSLGIFCTCAAIAIVVISAFAPRLTPAPVVTNLEKVRTLNGIDEYVLPNGMRVLLYPDPSAENVTVNVTYLVGSKHEGYGETGMAHLIEHMMFKGSTNHTNIPAEISARSAEANASTWIDRTNYFESLPASSENLAWALSLESDRMVNSFFRQEDLDSEFSVVRNEMEIGENDAFMTLTEGVTNIAYTWHNYGKSTIGARSDVEHVPATRLKDFYKKYYHPNNAVLVVAGNFTSEEALIEIQKTFGVLPKSPDSLPQTYTVEPPQEGERTVRIERVGGAPVFVASYHMGGVAQTDTPALEILSELLTENPNGPLFKGLVNFSTATSVNAELMMSKDPGLFMITMQEKNQSAKSLANEEYYTRDVLDLLASPEFLQKQITDKDFERAKTKLQEYYRTQQLNGTDFAINLSEWIATGDWREYFDYVERLKGVTRDDVIAVAGRYLRPNNRTFGVYVPVAEQTKVVVPEVDEKLLKKRLDVLKSTVTVTSGELLQPVPEEIERRVERKNIGDLHVAYMQKKTRANQVFATMRFHFGSVATLKGKGSISDIVPQLFMLGTATSTKQELEERLTKLQAMVEVTGGGTGAQVEIQAPKESFVEVLTLVYDVLKNPRITPSVVETLKQQQITGLEAQKTDPENIALDGIIQHYNPYALNDIRYPGTISELLAGTRTVTTKDVQQFYKDFYGTSIGEIGIVGEFDVASVENILKNSFGAWKSLHPYERVTYIPETTESMQVAYPAPDKQNAVFMAYEPLQMDESHPDYPALLLADSILGSDPFMSRLTERLREKDGLSYSSGSFLRVRSDGSAGSLVIKAVSAPQNIQKVTADVKEELSRMRGGKIPDDEFNPAKKSFITYYTQGLIHDESISDILVTQLYYNRTFMFEAEILKAVKALTADDVQRIAQKYLAQQNFSIVTAGGEK